MRAINYPKAQLEDPEHIRVGLCHPLLVAIADDQEGVDEPAILEHINDAGDVLCVPSLWVVEPCSMTSLYLI